MDQHDRFFTRRRIVKAASVATGAGALGVGGLFYSSQPALAATGTDPISADALDISANDESVTEVTVTSDLSLE